MFLDVGSEQHNNFLLIINTSLLNAYAIPKPYVKKTLILTFFLETFIIKIRDTHAPHTSSQFALHFLQHPTIPYPHIFQTIAPSCDQQTSDAPRSLKLNSWLTHRNSVHRLLGVATHERPLLYCPSVPRQLWRVGAIVCIERERDDEEEEREPTVAACAKECKQPRASLSTVTTTVVNTPRSLRSGIVYDVVRMDLPSRWRVKVYRVHFSTKFSSKLGNLHFFLLFK